MSRKPNLLSIGEIASLTNASVKSLRYYERIGLLKPAYTDPSSGYRYYTMKQAYLVSLIKFAIEMDIPLREFARMIDAEGTIDFRAFSTLAKEAAQAKMHGLKLGLGYIELFEQQISQYEMYPADQIYTRTAPDRHFYVIPHTQPFNAKYQYDIINHLFDFLRDESNAGGMLEEYVIAENGLLLERTPNGISRYVFIEVPPHKANYPPIPGGPCHCMKCGSFSIEHSQEIFQAFIHADQPFIAIETEILSEQINIHSIQSELCVMLI